MSELARVNDHLPSLFGSGSVDDNDDLSSGVSGGFSVISFRGSKWRVKHSGEETLLTNSEGEPMPSIRVVMLKANKGISKNYYAGAFTEGSTDSPDCWSVDGVHPDASVESPIHDSCATCPYNQFGSRITESGAKAKRCSDVRRVAVVPEGDYANERFGGPMLLRVPAASLSELASFGKNMKAKGYPYNTIVTRISFDTETAYPKLKFNAVRPITPDERQQLVELLADEAFTQKIGFVLASGVELQPSQAVAPAAKTPAKVERDPTEFEEEAVAPVVAPKATPKAAPAPKAAAPAPAPKAAPKATAKPAPAPEPAAAPVDDDELQSILSKLDSIE